MITSKQPLLIQVVPHLQPGRSGVSDHATQLAMGLKTEFGIESGFVILNGKQKCDAPYNFIECSAGRLLESCLELTQGLGGAVLVHMSGYGYSSDGAPTLLANALQQVRADGRFRITVYFHELYAYGPPWKSAFWYSRRQQRALRRLVANSGLILTNTNRHAEWLQREAQSLGRPQVEMIPVLSTVGETEEPVPFSKRTAAMAVFGLAGTRVQAYRKLSRWRNLASALGIEEIRDIGPECDQPKQIHGIPVKRIGLLPVEDVPAVFSQVRFGFVTHQGDFLGRSGVLASFCAQGVLPVLAEGFSGDAEGLRDGVHVLSAQTVEAARKAGLENCAHAAWNWYMGHRLRVHAERYAKWMGEGQ